MKRILVISVLLSFFAACFIGCAAGPALQYGIGTAQIGTKLTSPDDKSTSSGKLKSWKPGKKRWE